MNTIRQHTARWKTIKMHNFGANDCISILGIGFNDPSKIVYNKIHGIQDTPSELSLKIMEKGNRYEDTVRQLCAQRRGIAISETGLKYHKVHKFITASPDGYFRNPCEGVRTREPVLTEFKVRYQLSDKTPLKYWGQMQIQMEVWDIDKCLYCENVVQEFPNREAYLEGTTGVDAPHGVLEKDGVEYFWKLKEYREEWVHRDRAWFASVVDILCDYWSLVEQGRAEINNAPVTRSKSRGMKRKQMDTVAEVSGSECDLEILRTFEPELKKRRIYLNEVEDMVQPYNISNYIRRDPLLDWLELYGPIDKRDEPNLFLSMYSRKSREFRDRVITYIQKTYPDSTINIDPMTHGTGAEGGSYRDTEAHGLKITYENLEKTKAAMDQKIPVIFNAYLKQKVESYPYAIGGRVDMLVLNRFLHHFGVTDIPDESDCYSIFAIKYATINLRADKIHLLNNSKQKVYKAHLWILNSLLGLTQEHVPECAYLLGRKYDYKRSRNTFKVNNVFRGIGVVDFTEDDKDYEKQCQDALDWIARLREHGDEWSIGDIEVPELYPNMKNSADSPWHSYKSELATQLNDITLMYKCGPKVRDYAREMGITQWTQLTPETISYNSGKILTQIMQFVEANQPVDMDVDNAGMGMSGSGDADVSLQLPKHKLLTSVPCVEFYMDFEAIGNMYDNFSTFPEASNSAMIFLIGVVTVDNVEGTKSYTSYLIDHLSHESEKSMVQSMLNDFREAREKYEQNFSPVYFWSNAENYMLKRAIGPSVVYDERLVMIDLCKMFRDSGCILPGQFNYGLKDVAQTMKKHGMIQTIWKDSADICNGLDAMVDAIKSYHRHTPEERAAYFKTMIDYNYVDCKVMEEIMSYLRQCRAEPISSAEELGNEVVSEDLCEGRCNTQLVHGE